MYENTWNVCTHLSKTRVVCISDFSIRPSIFPLHLRRLKQIVILFLQKVYLVKEVSCCVWNITLTNYLFPFMYQEFRTNFRRPKEFKLCGTKRLVNQKQLLLVQPYHDRIKLSSNTLWSIFHWFLFPSNRESFFFFQLFCLGILFSQYSTSQNRNVPHPKLFIFQSGCVGFQIYLGHKGHLQITDYSQYCC